MATAASALARMQSAIKGRNGMAWARQLIGDALADLPRPPGDETPDDEATRRQRRRQRMKRRRKKTLKTRHFSLSSSLISTSQPVTKQKQRYFRPAPRRGAHKRPESRKLRRVHNV
jgi:hypothetical protein